ncbi:MAG TPA: GTP 3',8-cyclase MoaA [Acidobacteriota bacterium]|nr:GTP 3',8-cyclase MoaA [Acidobacteriota bacterium]
MDSCESKVPSEDGLLRDGLGRTMTDLRISVTDRCNFRCVYCMPLDKYEWIDRREILTFEELARVAGVFVRLGIEKVRLTGGEPLLRRDIERLIARLSPIPGLKDLCLTTNGSLLSAKIAALAEAGLKRLNVSVDTLDPRKFKLITRRDDLPAVLDGIFAAKRYGMGPIKINSVIERGLNDDEILDLVEFSRIHGLAIRFIEYMDVGNANNWMSEKMVSKKEILDIIGSRYPLRVKGRGTESAPSVDYEFVDGGGDLGVIASVTEPFCAGCTRIRLTADGKLVTCLFSESGHDLKGLLRRGAPDDEIVEFIRAVWAKRADRYSEERLEAMKSPKGYEAKAHRKIEMISLGG